MIIIHGKTGKCNINGEKVRKAEQKSFVGREKVYKPGGEGKTEKPGTLVSCPV